MFAGFPNINFIPSNYVLGFPGCIALFDPKVGLNTYTDTNPITSWIDQVGKFSFNSSGSGSNPTYNAADANFSNNPSINFTASNANLISAVPIGLAANFTILFAAYSQSFGSSNSLLRTSTVSTSPRLSTGGTVSGNTGIGIYSSPGGALLASTVEDTAPHISAISNNDIIVDGINVASGSCPSYGFTMLGTLASGINQSSLLGALGFLAFFNMSFTSADLIRLVDNLNSEIPTF